MASLLALLLAFLLLGAVVGTKMSDITFDQSYRITWGNDHVLSLNQGRLVQLSLDQSSGFILLLLLLLLLLLIMHVLFFCTAGAGFASKQSYGSGFFHMRIKLPPKDSAGVVTAYYVKTICPFFPCFILHA